MPESKTQIFRARVPLWVTGSWAFAAVVFVWPLIFVIIDPGVRDDGSWRIISAMAAVLVSPTVIFSQLARSYWGLTENELIMKPIFGRTRRIPYASIAAVVRSPRRVPLLGLSFLPSSGYSLPNLAICFRGKGHRLSRSTRANLPKGIKRKDLREFPINPAFVDPQIFNRLAKKLNEHGVSGDNDLLSDAAGSKEKKNLTTRCNDASALLFRKAGWPLAILLLLVMLYTGSQVDWNKASSGTKHTSLKKLAQKHIDVPSGKEIDSVSCNFVQDNPSSCAVYLKGESGVFVNIYIRDEGKGNYTFVKVVRQSPISIDPLITQNS